LQITVIVRAAIPRPTSACECYVHRHCLLIGSLVCRSTRSSTIDSLVIFFRRLFAGKINDCLQIGTVDSFMPTKLGPEKLRIMPHDVVHFVTSNRPQYAEKVSWPRSFARLLAGHSTRTIRTGQFNDMCPSRIISIAVPCGPTS